MANEFLSPGVRVRETETGPTPITGTPTAISAFGGRALRGPVNRRIRLTSFAQFQRIFGSFDVNSYLPLSVQAFFDTGGSVAYVNRVLGTSGGTNAKAAVTLSTTGGPTSGSLTSGAAFPAVLSPGDTFGGKVDGGGTLTATIQATRATVTGTGATYAAVTNGDALNVIINGIPGTQSIIFDGTESTQALFLATINAQIVGAAAANSGGQTRLSTDQRGSGAGGQVVSGAAAVLASLGLTAATNFTNAGPNNVADVLAVTSAELASLFNATFTGSTSVGGGTTLTWSSNTSGGSSSVQLISGTGVAKITGFDNAVHSGSASGSLSVLSLTAVGEGSDPNSFSVLVTKEDAKLVTSIGASSPAGSTTYITMSSPAAAAKMAAGDTLKLEDLTTAVTARVTVMRVQGSRVYFTAAVTLGAGGLTAANTSITNETFSLTIYYEGGLFQGPFTGLRLSPLSLRNYFLTRLNVPGDDEAAVVAADLFPVGVGLDLRPSNVITTGTGDPLTGGTEAPIFVDADYIGSQSLGTGLYAFDKTEDIRMFAVPGITGTVPGAVSKALIQYCEGREDCVAIVSPPAGSTPNAVLTYKRDVLGASDYGAMYYPHVTVLDPLTGQQANVPPEGFVMGMTARSDGNRGVQKAPAGEATGRLTNAIGVERILSKADKDLLYPANINPIESISGVGVAVMGSRTMQSGQFNQLHIRRTFIFLRTSMQQGTRWVVFEENTEQTRNTLRESIESFLATQWRQGVLVGATRDKAFTVVCDTSNNPDAVVFAQQMIADVAARVPQTTENLLISISQSRAAA